MLIGDRDYYVENWLSLAVNGNGSWARVIATDAERDLAILQLNFLREDSRGISYNPTPGASLDLNRNELVHILGNPGGQKLWRWTLGLFQSDDSDWLHINADIYQGNSGGPVLNGRGELVGIITLSNLRTDTWAVPARFVTELMDTVHPKHTFRIRNNDRDAMNYEVKWSASGDWTQHSVGPQQPITHWSGGTLSTGYPKIRFNSDGILGWGADRSYSIEAFLRYFGDDYRNHVTRYDAYEYIFDIGQDFVSIDLYRGNSDGCIPRDVNGDGVTDLQDLEYIGANVGLWLPAADADVDNDGDVDAADIIFAAGLTCTIAAAPSLNLEGTTTLTSTNLQHWIQEGKALGISDPTFQRGIAVLEQLLAAVQAEAVPKDTALMPNYPNPFNPETWIPYKLSEPAEVTVSIYGAEGYLVRTLTLGHQPAGVYQDKSRAAYWDGRNALGEPVASGLYFYTLKAGDFTATRKMLIRK